MNFRDSSTDLGKRKRSDDENSPPEKRYVCVIARAYVSKYTVKGFKNCQILMCSLGDLY